MAETIMGETMELKETQHLKPATMGEGELSKLLEQAKAKAEEMNQVNFTPNRKGGRNTGAYRYEEDITAIKLLYDSGEEHSWIVKFPHIQSDNGMYGLVGAMKKKLSEAGVPIQRFGGGVNPEYGTIPNSNDGEDRCVCFRINEGIPPTTEAEDSTEETTEEEIQEDITSGGAEETITS